MRCCRSIYQERQGRRHLTQHFGVGDFFAERHLSWHLKQLDFSLGAGRLGADRRLASHPPPPRPRRAGLLDADAHRRRHVVYRRGKNWAVSALNRYEFNTEQRDTDITPGQAYTLEWGVAKTFNKVIDVGAVGYYQQQTTSDSGASSSNSRDRVAAIGPEISARFSEADVVRLLPLSLRIHGGEPGGRAHVGPDADEAILARTIRVTFVAQSCTLLYRRIAFCGRGTPKALARLERLPITNRRYSRVQLCATPKRPALLPAL